VTVSPKTFVDVALAPQVEHGRRRTFTLRRFGAFQRALFARQHPAPHQILPGDVEVAQRCDLISPGRVTGEGYVVRAAPIPELAVITAFENVQDGALVMDAAQRRVGLAVVPQGGQVRGEVVPQKGVDLLQNAGRAGHHAALSAAAQRAGLIGEDGTDGFAKVLAQHLGVAVVHQVDEHLHRRRVEDVPGGRLILRGAFADVMQPADVRIQRAVDHRDARAVPVARHRHQVVARRKAHFLALRQHRPAQAAALEGRVGRHHLPAG